MNTRNVVSVAAYRQRSHLVHTVADCSNLGEKAIAFGRAIVATVASDRATITIQITMLAVAPVGLILIIVLFVFIILLPLGICAKLIR